MRTRSSGPPEEAPVTSPRPRTRSQTAGAAAAVSTPVSSTRRALASPTSSGRRPPPPRQPLPTRTYRSQGGRGLGIASTLQFYEHLKECGQIKPGGGLKEGVSLDNLVKSIGRPDIYGDTGRAPIRKKFQRKLDQWKVLTPDELNASILSLQDAANQESPEIRSQPTTPAAAETFPSTAEPAAAETFLSTAEPAAANPQQALQADSLTNPLDSPLAPTYRTRALPGNGTVAPLGSRIRASPPTANEPAGHVA